MKAMVFNRYGGPEVLELATLPDPQPGPGEVRIAVKAASVNPVDWKIRSGMLEKFFPITFPAVAGRDGAGVVEALGEDVSTPRIGDKVVFMAPRGQGTLAEKVVMKADRAIAMPAHLSFEQGAAFPLAGVSAWIALVDTARIRAGQSVLVHAGAGGVGGLAIQIAKAFGCTVAATASAANRDYVRGLGADPVIAYDQEKFWEKLSGFDVVFDSLGGEVHRHSYAVLKKGGVLVYLIAKPIADLSAEHGVDLRMAVVKDDPAALRGLAELVAQGKVVPQVSHVRSWREVGQAQAENQTGHAKGKTVLRIEE